MCAIYTPGPESWGVNLYHILHTLYLIILSRIMCVIYTPGSFKGYCCDDIVFIQATLYTNHDSWHMYRGIFQKSVVALCLKVAELGLQDCKDFPPGLIGCTEWGCWVLIGMVSCLARYIARTVLSQKFSSVSQPCIYDFDRPCWASVCSTGPIEKNLLSFSTRSTYIWYIIWFVIWEFGHSPASCQLQFTLPHSPSFLPASVHPSHTPPAFRQLLFTPSSLPQPLATCQLQFTPPTLPQPHASSSSPLPHPHSLLPASVRPSIASLL